MVGIPPRSLQKQNADNRKHIDPDHYKGDAVARFIELFDLNWREANVVKYIARKTKPDVPRSRDLGKCLWYLKREIKAEAKARADKLKLEQVHGDEQAKAQEQGHTFEGTSGRAVVSSVQGELLSGKN